ncbi:MAG: phosphoglycerate kinase [Acidimicrobiaceae bacterium]|nr:phosphoglycerate kinase [Acidimicrobiaceae bacterium]MXZ65593.1 phosphoglycerate kinase [Acidimicrobiaceae bacterium]MYF33181.1 phosphoglycerate kinase [Acidimicrobiaceae bacterium]MYG77334.1 phosphoglycerate kinase [Acidimicrobiaceae bacterium]MYJ85505.1 phosphoglycerate kinase [Acidimicrobiaceae bacterium]
MLPVPQLEDLGPLDGRSVLVRVDFNVPLAGGGPGAVAEIADDLRMRAALPTLRWLQKQGATVTACTHLGRPQDSADPRFSVEPVRRRLAELAPDAKLLENLRFDAGETADDPAFVDRLVEGHDAYVNDAFGASHRAHASIVGPPRRLPSAAGRLLAREVEVLGGLRESPRRPFVAVLGGAKVSDKLGVIDALLETVDSLVIGGAMCFTFLKAQGHSVGASLCEDSMVERCRELLEGETPIHLPYDLTALGPGGVPGDPGAGGDVRQIGANVGDGWMGVDIGPGSAAAFGDVIHEAGTVLWNGPMGVFEDPRFGGGTGAVAAAMAETRAFTVVGGGDSAAAARRFGVDRDMDHVSTGGGASLELIEKGDLPGLAALRGASNAT